MRTRAGLLEGLREAAEEHVTSIKLGADANELRVGVCAIENIVKELLNRRVSCRKIEKVLIDTGLDPKLTALVT